MSYMFGVYYVKTDAPIQELAARFGRAAPAGPGWLACGMSEDLLPDDAYQDQDAEDPEVTATGEISKVYGEAVYLFANSHADEVIYEHTRDGVVLRKLAQARETVAPGAPVLALGSATQGFVLLQYVNQQARLTGWDVSLRRRLFSDDDLGDYLAGCLSEPQRHNRILPIGGPGPAIMPREQGGLLFRLLGQPPRFKQVPVALLDGIIGVLGTLGHVVPPLAAKAELARIGRYYATESMLVLDPATGRYSAEATPSYGRQALQDHYAALLRGDSKAQGEAFRNALGGPGTGDGYMAVNEVRALQNLPPLSDPDANVPFKAQRGAPVKPNTAPAA